MSFLRDLARAYVQQRGLGHPRHPFGHSHPGLVPGAFAIGALRRWGESPVAALAGRPRRDAEVRASDADREAVISFLNRHCAEGRLSTDELSARVEAAYAAVALSGLEPLTSDLPGSPFARPAPPEASRRGAALLRRLALVGVSVLVFVALASVVPAEVWVQLLVLGVPFVLIALFSILPFALPVLAMIWMIRSLSGDDRARRMDERGWRGH